MTEKALKSTGPEMKVQAPIEASSRSRPSLPSLSFLAALGSAFLGMFQFGHMPSSLNQSKTNIMTFIIKALKNTHGLTFTDDRRVASICYSVLVSLTVVGGMVGGLASSPLGNRLGRRPSLALGALISILGAVLILLSIPFEVFELVAAGRLLSGFAVGIFTGLAPVYVNEISPESTRGLYGSMMQVAASFAGFVTAGLGLKASPLGKPESWQILVGMNGPVALLQLALLFKATESPKHLILTRQHLEAGRASLERLRGTSAVDNEFEKIKAEAATEAKAASGSYRTIGSILSHRDMRLSLTLCACVHMSQRVSGLVVILFYSTAILEQMRFSGTAIDFINLGIYGEFFLMSLVGLLAIGMFGRRSIHLWGLTITVLCLSAMTICQVTETMTREDRVVDDPNLASIEATSDSKVALLVLCVLWVVGFGVGPGSTPWIVTSEMFDQGSRASASSVATFTNWLSTLICALSYPFLGLALKELSLVPFIVVSIFLLVFLFLYLPETKSRSPVEVSLELRQPGAWGRFRFARKGCCVQFRHKDSSKAVDLQNQP